MNTYTYNPPHLVDANLWLNLDPGFITSSGAISSWKNALDVSDDFVQAISGKRPTDNGTHISFDGNDWLGSGSGQIYDTGTNGWTAVMRYTSEDWTVNDAVLGDDSANTSFITNNGNTGFTIKAWDGSGSVTRGITIDTPESLVNSTYYNFIIQCDSSVGNLTLWIDGIEQEASSDLGATYDIIIDEIGAKSGTSMALTGSMQEIIMFDTCFTDTQVEDMTVYLNNKF